MFNLIEISNSLCSKLRLNISNCSHCLQICPFDAISIDNYIEINQSRCTQCGLCHQVCPTNAIDFVLPFEAIKNAINHNIHTVIGCSFNSLVDSNIKSHCVGSFTIELLLYIQAFANNKVQINLTHCKDCKNSSAYNDFLHRKYIFERQCKIVFSKVDFVENPVELNFKKDIINRRSFFKKFVGTALNTKQYVSQGFVHNTKKNFREKFIPLKRKLLNLSADYYSDAEKESIQRFFYHSLQLNKPDNISKVAAFCPTGAIFKLDESEFSQYSFNDSYCINCKLCVEAESLFDNL